MLQACFGQAAVACLTQAERAHGLREGAFYLLALGVEAPALGRALPCPGGGERLVLRLRQDREHPAFGACL